MDESSPPPALGKLGARTTAPRHLRAQRSRSEIGGRRIRSLRSSKGPTPVEVSGLEPPTSTLRRSSRSSATRDRVRCAWSGRHAGPPRPRVPCCSRQSVAKPLPNSLLPAPNTYSTQTPSRSSQRVEAAAMESLHLSIRAVPDVSGPADDGLRTRAVRLSRSTRRWMTTHTDRSLRLPTWNANLQRIESPRRRAVTEPPTKLRSCFNSGTFDRTERSVPQKHRKVGPARFVLCRPKHRMIET
jgi:hypothetical protein